MNWRDFKMALLAIDGNAKTVKGQKFGYLTGIMYLAPADNSEKINVCPMAEIAGCKKACLYSAGRGKFTNVQAGRLRKTLYFAEDYEGFMNELASDINRLINRAKKNDVIPLVRLNGTSDIIWERKEFTLNESIAKRIKRPAGHYSNLMELFPEVTFYDYTKIAGRFNDKLPKNYDLTFSYSGVESYQKQVEFALRKGARIAVVFRDDNYPVEFMGMKVINGDMHDIRPTEPQGVIVGLYAKGDAKKDSTGFVVDTATAVLV
ncbi:GP88 family protein [Viridibacillus arvi]|uniref:GP88 family protein n=1 Tax=Viridibacillus arvi TaxID=263475 RepID=UPI0034CE115D